MSVARDIMASNILTEKLSVTREMDITAEVVITGDVEILVLNLGHSGAAGQLNIFPATAALGKLQFVAANSAGNTTTTITNASQAAARTYTIPDAGASASFVLSAGTVPTVLALSTAGSRLAVNAPAVPTFKGTPEAITDDTALTAAQITACGVMTYVTNNDSSNALPAAAAVVAALPNCFVGEMWELLIVNTSANLVTITAGGATIVGTATIATLTSKRLRFRLTNVTAAAEAYTCYM
jgi:hypothetical protein